jgi:hypothetical protein
MALYDGWDPPRPGWVCAECGLDYGMTPPAAVGRLLHPLVSEYRARLEGDAGQLRVRPDRSTWSALEYACHVRDCFALYDWRIRTVLAEERPEFPQMRRDAIAVEHGYNDQRPADVAGKIAANHARLAGLLDHITGTEWQRVGIREGEPLSIAWMAVNTLHEARHHLMDIDRVLREPAN